MTPEQKKDFDDRVKIVDEAIKKILTENEVTIIALPAFQEIKGGQCAAIGITQYRDVKKYKTESIPEPVEVSVDPTNPQP